MASTPKLSVSSKDVRSTSIRPIARRVGTALLFDGVAEVEVEADIRGVLALARCSAGPNDACGDAEGAGLLPRGAGTGDAMAEAPLPFLVVAEILRRNLVAGERDHGGWSRSTPRALQRIVKDIVSNGWRLHFLI